MHNERVEVARIGEGTAHHQSIRDAPCTIGEGDRAGCLQKADLGHLLAVETFGQSSHGLNMHDRGVARAPQDEVDDCRIVDCGRCVGLANDGGHAARGRGLTRGGEGLAIFRAWLADKGSHIDQPGRDDSAFAIDHFSPFGHSGGADSALGFADEAVGDQKIAGKVEVARRIEDPGIGEQDRAAVGQHGLSVRQVARQGFEHRHANGDTHLDLLADQRLGAVGNGGIDFDAAIHRARMHHQRVRLGVCELLLIETEIGEIFLCRGTKDPFMRSRCSRSIMTMSASVQARRFMSRVNTSTPSRIWAMPEGNRVEGAITRTRAPSAFSRIDVRAGDAGMGRMSPQIATDEAGRSCPLLPPDGECVEQGLGRVFVRAVPGIHHGTARPCWARRCTAPAA